MQAQMKIGRALLLLTPLKALRIQDLPPLQRHTVQNELSSVTIALDHQIVQH